MVARKVLQSECLLVVAKVDQMVIRMAAMKVTLTVSLSAEETEERLVEGWDFCTVDAKVPSSG